MKTWYLNIYSDRIHAHSNADHAKDKACDSAILVAVQLTSTPAQLKARFKDKPITFKTQIKEV